MNRMSLQHRDRLVRTLNELARGEIGGRPSLDGKARVRRCLNCGNDFQSDGPGHRICDGCRRSDTYRAGVDTSYRLVL